MADRVLVIGSGGREHALAWKLAQSPHVKQVLVAPGNAGTADNGKISNSAVLVSNHTILAQFCKDHNIGLVVVGPEAHLGAGIVDDLMSAGVRCFGPSAKAAQLQTNTSFAKAFLDCHGIPTARWKAFANPQEACSFITSTDFPALVIKASGQAARKEIIIAASKEEACRAVQEILQDKVFGETGETVVIEELLEGEELSCLCFTDGVTVAPMPLVQAHKQLMDGDQGPNTAGMGAYCPVPQIPEALLEKIKDSILQHIVDCMRQEGTTYVGVLQTGLVRTKDDVKIINFDCHFGDPQCQVILPLLKNDFYEVIQATIDGKLCSCMPAWSENRTAVSVVMASEGYPGDYVKGMEVTGLLQAQELGVTVFHAGTTMQDDKVVTDGGRVLTVTAIKKDLMAALEEANKGVAAIRFQGAIYRKDIGYQAVAFLQRSVGLIHGDVRVDTITSSALINQSEPPAATGSRSELPKSCPGHFLYAGSHAELGGSTDFFDLKSSGYDDPILVSRTKGIGSKLQIAQMCKKHDTIGQDLVAMCINDILAQGAEPLFFLDYFACGKLDAEVAQAVIAGIAEACKKAGCPLLGRETAEMPGMYSPGEYDLAGFAVGAVERGQMFLQQERVAEGDVVIGLASSGIHSHGFNLVRKILLMSSLHYSSPVPGGCGDQPLGELLLTPTKIYSKALLPVLRSGHVKAFAPITGGGLMESIPRILPESFSVILDAYSWQIPEIFSWLQTEGNLSEEEMARTFNCGIGAVLMADKELAQQVLKDVQRHEEAWLIGNIVPSHTGSSHVKVKNLLKALQLNRFQFLQNAADTDSHLHVEPQKSKVKVAVLISGTGTNLAALIAYAKEPASCAQIVLVISNKSGDVEELRNAARAGIPTRVVDYKLYGSRSEFDCTIDRVLEEFSVELICLAGFMRILSSAFIRKWNGKILNICPSLLPSVKGGNAHKQVLQPGVKVTGCTVHFVLEEANTGAIILQEPVSVNTDDTEETLLERVKEAECRVFPIALQLVASGMVRLGADGKTCWKQGTQSLTHHEKQDCISSTTTLKPQQYNRLQSNE
ncbi:trifunctional purine biosynthetic protein adenosine-3-like [Malaclemys terrapin pileata]|uniref:trifunctional purine biosynthetic protein adenosine-3-like n=1 Tax=Malaclemys terrapin pileata TaxID=2991368 RepID=UPI0023A7E092|nr:trifunctional purine biosynthetic protein adenosine-3-like [Malaclemys terrapin pileata]